MFEKVNCKDCAHFKGCRRTYASATPGDSAYADFEKNEMYDCSSFMPKTEWVHLPCKVGDTVYCFAPFFDADHHPKLKVVEKEIVELKTIATVFGLNFDIDSIGKTIFLTSEEAEKALEERKEK